MAIGIDDVSKIAHLARLEIADRDVDQYASELSNILALVEQMNRVETASTEPMAHPLHMTQRLRADAVTEPDCRDDYQRIAPQTEDGLYLVPKVID